MSIAAQVSRVEVRPRGSSLVADVAAGATQVTVADPTLFGATDRVQVGDDVRDYTSRTLSDAPPDVDGNPQQYATLTLLSGLSSALIMGTPVVLWSGDASTGQRLSDVVLWVDQFTPEAQPVPVVVPSAERDRWTRYEGIVDPPIPGTLSDDQQTFTADPGYQPLIDGTLIDPTTLPDTGSPSLIYIGVRPEADVAGDFTPGVLPDGWDASRVHQYGGTGPVGAGVPGVSVVDASSAPAGASGGVLLIDTGASRTENPASSAGQPAGYFSAAGQIQAGVDATSAEVRIRYRANQAAYSSMIVAVAIRGDDYASAGNGAVASGAADGYIGFRLPRPFPSNSSNPLEASLVVKSPDTPSETILGDPIPYVGTVGPADGWAFAALRVESGQVSAKAWADSVDEPPWVVRSSPFSAVSGDIGILWDRPDPTSPYLPSLAVGRRWWIDQFEATILAAGLQVDEDAEGDWPNILNPIRTKTSAAYELAAGFGDRLASVESSSSNQGARLGAVELKNIQQDTRLATNEQNIAANGGRLTTLEQPTHIGLRGDGSTQSIPNATWTTLAVPSSAFSNGAWSPASSVVTIPSTGIYTAEGFVNWGASSAGRRLMRVETFTGSDPGAGNGTTVVSDERSTIAYTLNLGVSLGYAFNAGDKVRLIGYQTSGGALSTFTTGGLVPRLTLRKISSS